MEIATMLAGKDASQILNNPRLLFDYEDSRMSADDIAHAERVINSVVLSLFVEDVSGNVHGYSFGGGGSSSSSSSSSASARARSMAAAAVGGVVGGALSEVGARAVSFMGTNR